MDNFNLTQPKPKIKRKQISQNFIEAIKDVGGSFGSQVKNLGSGVASSAVDSLLGRNSDQSNSPDQGPPSYPMTQNYPSKPFNFEEYLYNRDRQIRAQERTLSQRLRDNEKVLYNRKEEQTKQQILCVKEEIKKIIKETDGLAIELLEVEKTVSTTVVTGGSYHLNFFERIRQLLVLARKRIAESRSWLELFNSRQKQRYCYWGQVSKSGTKFLLSADRYTATQAG